MCTIVHRIYIVYTKFFVICTINWRTNDMNKKKVYVLFAFCFCLGRARLVKHVNWIIDDFVVGFSFLLLLRFGCQITESSIEWMNTFNMLRFLSLVLCVPLVIIIIASLNFNLISEFDRVAMPWWMLETFSRPFFLSLNTNHVIHLPSEMTLFPSLDSSLAAVGQTKHEIEKFPNRK